MNHAFPRSTSRLRAAVAALLLVALSAFFAPVGAFAHAGLTSSSPSEDESVETVPDAVSLSFSESVREPVHVVVTAPDGSTHSDSDPVIDGGSVTQAIDLSTVATAKQVGTWTVAYRVVSSDGHPITGHVRFRAAGEIEAPPASQTPESTPTTAASDEADATPTSKNGNAAPFVVALIAGLLVVVAAVVNQRRKKQA